MIKGPALSAAILLASIASTTACASRLPQISPGTSAAAEPIRGTPGDTVRVIINHVSADRREAFEHFAHGVLFPAMRKVAPSDPVTAAQLRRARLLHPVKPDSDGTYTYVFLVDPVVTSAGYGFPALLGRVYPPDQAASLYQEFRNSLARPQETYLVVNDRW